MSTIFKKIIDKEIPAEIIYEDDHCLAFKDVNPQAPTHVLLIPRKEIPTIQDASKEDKEILGHMLITVPEIAKKLELSEKGYRLVVNCKEDGGQTVLPSSYAYLRWSSIGLASRLN